MKVLWLCSTATPDVAKCIGIRSAVNVSWIVNAINSLKVIDGYDVGICFPVNNSTEIISGKADGICYFGFPQKKPNPTVYNESLEGYFDSIIQQFVPDVIHIWGTEYPHTLSMLKSCEKAGLLDSTVVSIQGLCSIYCKHYYAMLPQKILKHYTLFDMLKRENIKTQCKNYEKRGVFEIESLKLAKNVIGRTDWDEACTKQINPDLCYYFCNETLRKTFYENRWDINKCQRHSVFVSQGYYPVKGLHLVIEAIAILAKEYSDVHLYVGGLDMVNRGVKTSSYGKYIKKLISSYMLEDKITFAGTLNEEQMCRQYLDSHVFVSASSIENSPNSVGEAMLLGMPVVSSDVGGVKNLMTHGVDGFIYPFDEPYMIAHYVKKIFDDDILAIKMGEEASERAKKTHDVKLNLDTLVKIYNNL